MNFLFDTVFLTIFAGFGALILTSCSTALLTLGKYHSKEWLRSDKSQGFFFRPFLHKSMRGQEWENFYFAISMSRQIYMLGYSICAFLFLIFKFERLAVAIHNLPQLDDWMVFLASVSAIIATMILFDYFFRIAANLWSTTALFIAAPFASLYLLLLFPIVGTLLYGSRKLLRKVHLQEDVAKLLTDKSKLRDLIRESELQQHLSLADEKLIASFLVFKERVAKEIMVPRVKLFALESSMPIRDATKIFAQEGYSRIPIYLDTLDHIIGVILYKDLLKAYASEDQDLEAKLQTLAKPVLYAPENKKISHLLQEFRMKKIHMAIIVDEYGGTEGIVTIEDILEELVGEIEDEYDIGADRDITELPSGGWVIDAKVTIGDIEGQTGIKIPESPEYETLGGYIFHLAGTIPAKGWRLSRDEFDLEVLSSDERSLKKIRITPRKAPSIEG